MRLNDSVDCSLYTNTSLTLNPAFLYPPGNLVVFFLFCKPMCQFFVHKTLIHAHGALAGVLCLGLGNSTEDQLDGHVSSNIVPMYDGFRSGKYILVLLKNSSFVILVYYISLYFRFDMAWRCFCNCLFHILIVTIIVTYVLLLNFI